MLNYVLLLIVLLNGCTSYNRYYDPEKSHHTKEGFTNPYIQAADDKSFSDRLKFFKMIFSKPEISKKHTNHFFLKKSQLDSLATMNDKFAVWVGHSTVLLYIDGRFILTDPIFSERCSPVSFAGPKRYSKSAISIDELPPIDMVLISHNHYDHLDSKTVKLLGNKTKWIVPLGLKNWFLNQGINNVNEYDWWEEDNFGNIKLTCLPSQHWSKRSLFKSFDSLWASWAIDINGFKFWFAGDTGYNDIQFKEIGDLKGPFNFSAIPIGAYEPRWFMKNFHVNPYESVLIHNDVKSLKTIGIHWGTFVLTTEPVDEPPMKLKDALVKYDVKSNDFITTNIGEIIFFD